MVPRAAAAREPVNAGAYWAALLAISVLYVAAAELTQRSFYRRAA